MSLTVAAAGRPLATPGAVSTRGTNRCRSEVVSPLLLKTALRHPGTPNSTYHLRCFARAGVLTSSSGGAYHPLTGVSIKTPRADILSLSSGGVAHRIRGSSGMAKIRWSSRSDLEAALT